MPLPEPIGISEAISIFTALPSDGGAFIVGGQALNLWAELYAGTAPELLHPATRRSDATAMRQLEAAPIIVREYISETVGEGETREAGRCLRCGIR